MMTLIDFSQKCHFLSQTNIPQMLCPMLLLLTQHREGSLFWQIQLLMLLLHNFAVSTTVPDGQLSPWSIWTITLRCRCMKLTEISYLEPTALGR